ncbi:tol-pal system protein YbgF [Aureimonas populi]|uniref:Cell division coordinator CpoB n=1 Tax=Aureimonas populi TaxID=1701758 RepID=A0ABW5CGP8_9HYPH|nr:tol-pal system protein YbgF [Aureimonas populi]
MANFLFPSFASAALAVAVSAAPAAAISLPFDLGGRSSERAAASAAEERPVLMAQASDVSVRISQMEEEMRRLTGKVEEMSFLVLQLQEQLRNTQEDNEMRFQDLEGGSGGGGAAPERRSQAVPSAGSGDGEFALGLPGAAPRAPEAAPQDDEIGALLDNASLRDIGAGLSGGGAPAASPAPGSQTVASIAPNGPVELYSLAYNYMLAGDYHLAEQSFRQYAQAYPDSDDTPDAQYWLGESLFAQSKYRDAAEVFLTAQKEHPESGKAPEMMLKLGMSLARLDNRETACVTYAEVQKRYPSMTANVKRKLDEERSQASCS